MDNMNTTQHISHQFNAEMLALRNHVMSMGGMVEQQILGAVAALQALDAIAAERIIRNDHKVNAMEVSIDEECARILARRQPTASDLRMVVAVIKTITDLERIGDEAEKIASMAVHMAEQDGRYQPRYAGVQHLGKHVSTMIHDALDAFARMDVGASLSVLKADEIVDAEYQMFMRQMITYMMEDPRTISEILNMIWAARALERIGDHAKNICEYVIYLVKGKDVRHIDLQEIEKDIKS
jgi:phosphate transport system protein